MGFNNDEVTSKVGPGARFGDVYQGTGDSTKKYIYFDIDLYSDTYEDESDIPSSGVAYVVSEFTITVEHSNGDSWSTSTNSNRILHHVDEGESKKVTISYEIYFDAYLNGEFYLSNNNAFTDEESITIDMSVAEDPIDNWYWDTNIYKGREVSDVSYTEWNSLINKIDELLDTGHYGKWLTDSSQGATLSMSASKMSSSDKTLTAARFNSVRYNIGAHRGTGVSRVYSGDIVYASYFDGLETGINNWIDDYNDDYT